MKPACRCGPGWPRRRRLLFLPAPRSAGWPTEPDGQGPPVARRGDPVFRSRVSSRLFEVEMQARKARLWVLHLVAYVDGAVVESGQVGLAQIDDSSRVRAGSCRSVRAAAGRSPFLPAPPRTAPTSRVARSPPT